MIIPNRMIYIYIYNRIKFYLQTNFLVRAQLKYLRDTRFKIFLFFLFNIYFMTSKTSYFLIYFINYMFVVFYMELHYCVVK